VFSVLTGVGAYAVYTLFIAAETSKLMLVAKCVGVGIVGMLVYLVGMGSMLPTKEILNKLRGKKA